MPTRRRPLVPAKPTLSVRQILAWADAHYTRWGRWPNRHSGRIPGTDETWCAIDGALLQGCRGLPKGGALIKLLAQHRGYRHKNYLPRLRVNDILAWADAHRRRTGEWPSQCSGPVAEAPGATWTGIKLALSRGTRGLRGGTSLADLLARRRGRRHAKSPPPLTVGQILGWAEAHHTLFGLWPTRSTTTRIGSTGRRGTPSTSPCSGARAGSRETPRCSGS